MTKPAILLLYLSPLDWSSIAAPPYGLEILAASVKDLNARVVIHNPFLQRDFGLESQRLIQSLDPIVVGLSLRNLDNLAHVWDTEGEFHNGIQSHSFLSEIERAIDVIRQHTAAPLVMGGRGFSIDPVGLLRKFGLRVGVRGPGETAFRRLVQAALRGEDVEAFAVREAATLPGLVVLEDSAVVVNNDPEPAPFRMELPLLERMAEYDPSWTALVPVRVSEGCSGRCAFCVEARRYSGVVWRSPEQVVAEMAALDFESARAVWLTCGEFNLPDEEYAINLCHQIAAARLSEAVLYSYFWPRPFSPDLYCALREVGFTDHSICFDIVHPSDRVLERNQVGFRRRDIDNLFDTLAQVGASGFTVGFMLGLPGETEKTLVEAVEWVREADALFGKGLHCSYNCGARVYPGTGLAQIARDEERDGVLYGANDPDCLLPVVYATPWSPRRIAEFFQSACAGCRGDVTGYTKSNPMFHERPEVVISWQYAHARRSASDLEGAVAEFRKALSLAASSAVQEWIAENLASCLVRLGRLKEVRELKRFFL
jgi:hypothetical protein